jgi:hypothetical protein
MFSDIENIGGNRSNRKFGNGNGVGVGGKDREGLGNCQIFNKINNIYEQEYERTTHR